MAYLKRTHQKIIVMLLAWGFSVIVFLIYTESHRQKAVLFDGTINNAFAAKPGPPVLTNKYWSDVKNDKANVSLPSSGLLANFSYRDFKRTLYPVTLFAPYLLENSELCRAVPELDVLVIVHTAPQHNARRLAIRATWTNQTYLRDLGQVRVLFLLGQVKDLKVQQDIEAEFKEHGDILQGDFIDAYTNLTHKGVMAYKWLTERCRNAKLILKCDDDLVINMYAVLTKYLPIYQNKTNQIFCNHIHAGSMPILRMNTSKWYVEENLFKGYSYYPQYCSGFTVFFTNDFIPALYRAAFLTPFFWVDDVYLYGLVPGKLTPAVKYDTFKNGDVALNEHEAVKCYKNTTRTCRYLIVGSGNHERVHKVWGFMTEQYQSGVAKVGYTLSQLAASVRPRTNGTG